MKRILIFTVLSLVIITSFSFMQISKQSIVTTQGGIIENFTNLDNATFVEDVEISDNTLSMCRCDLSSVPEDSDHWTETDASINGTISSYNFGEADRIEITTEHFDAGSNDNNSVAFVDVNSTGAGTSFLWHSNSTSYDLTNASGFSMKIKINDSIVTGSILTIAQFIIYDTSIKRRVYQNISFLETGWNNYSINFEEAQITEDTGYNASNTVWWIAVLAWVGDIPTDNYTVLIDHAHFEEMVYPENATFISDWINPNADTFIWKHATMNVLNDKDNYTELYVTFDNVTWISIENKSYNMIMLEKGRFLFKVLLSRINKTTAPYVEFVLFEYVSIYDLVLGAILFQTTNPEVLFENIWFWTTLIVGFLLLSLVYQYRNIKKGSKSSTKRKRKKK